MSTLYIRLPSKAAADSAPNWLALPCPFARVSHGSAIDQQGTTSLSDLSGTVAKSQRVVLLLAASDVTLLRVRVPPLSPARLKAALPNLVEDRLIADPADCVIVASGLSDGLRTIAVVQRVWLDLLARTLTGFGAGNISALPAQSCLSFQQGVVTVAIEQRDTDMDMTLRLSEQDGLGLAISVANNESAASVAISTLCTVVPETPVTLYVPESVMHDYRQALDQNDALGRRCRLFADNWPLWITCANVMPLDLMAGLGTANNAKLDWQPWRWPLVLAAAVLFINATALNYDWWRMQGEIQALRASMIQIYKTAYPKESVIIDPIAQMQQKVAATKHDLGLAAADDFTLITAAFGEAWASAGMAPGGTDIAALEYHDRSLTVRLKPAMSRAEGHGGDAPTQLIKDALSKHNLALEFAPEQSGAVVWQIRSAK